MAKRKLDFGNEKPSDPPQISTVITNTDPYPGLVVFGETHTGRKLYIECD